MTMDVGFAVIRGVITRVIHQWGSARGRQVGARFD
jgi:hypothetical protein